LGKLDYKTKIILCLIILNALSLISLYSSLHTGGEFRNKDIFYRQIIWISISWIFLVIFSFINYRLYFDLSIGVYVANLILLITVEIWGKKAMGAQRWLSLGIISFQPSEVSKLAILLILSRVFSFPFKDNTKHVFLYKVLVPLGLVLIDVLLVFRQPDLGTAVVCLLLFFMMGLGSGVKKRYFLTLFLIFIFLSPLGWQHLKEYQKKRFIVFLDPNIDPLGAGYTIIQSKIAVGSGRLYGKGFLSGTQSQFNFLPERHTDFIFTVLAEEWGFLGVLFLFFIYYTLLRTILDKAAHSEDNFASSLCIGIASLFFLHIFINIGMTIGILPVVGLPLIFLSYGGTHILVSFILLGIFFNIVRKC